MIEILNPKQRHIYCGRNKQAKSTRFLRASDEANAPILGIWIRGVILLVKIKVRTVCVLGDEAGLKVSSVTTRQG